MKQRQKIIGALAVVIAVSGAALSFAGSVAAQDRPNIDATVRQFHINHSKNEVEKNGALVDDDVIVHLNGGADNEVNGATFKGREAFVVWLKQNKAIFPDGKITDQDIVVSGNMAAIRFTLEGTHTGPIPAPNGPLQATGRKVRIEGTEFFTFNKSGKVVHLETLTNDLSVLGFAAALKAVPRMAEADSVSARLRRI